MVKLVILMFLEYENNADVSYAMVSPLTISLLKNVFCWLILGQIHFSINDVVSTIVHVRFWKGMFFYSHNFIDFISMRYIFC